MVNTKRIDDSNPDYVKLITLLVLLAFFCPGSARAGEADSLRMVIYQMQQASNGNSIGNDVARVAIYSLVPFVVAFSFIVFIFYRNRRELQFRQKEAEMKSQVAEVEMKALRAQINPHFIFNCLNSIYLFMEANKLQQAGEYLTKFSNLIRIVLENSMHREVSLADDLFALRLYIEMEQLRMNYAFDYILKVDPELDLNHTMVPPHIVQPFVENSIWHGLSNKPEQGTLSVSVSQDGGMLKYCVEDDGVKAKLADAVQLANVKKKSLGMSLTKERLEVLNQTRKSNAGFTVTDILDEQHRYKGKKVVLLLPFISELEVRDF